MFVFVCMVNLYICLFLPMKGPAPEIISKPRQISSKIKLIKFLILDLKFFSSMQNGKDSRKYQIFSIPKLFKC